MGTFEVIEKLNKIEKNGNIVTSNGLTDIYFGNQCSSKDIVNKDSLIGMPADKVKTILGRSWECVNRNSEMWWLERVPTGKLQLIIENDTVVDIL